MDTQIDDRPHELADGRGDLLRRLRLHDEAAVRAVIQRNNRRLYRIARSILRDDSEAEDALQESYLKAFANLDAFRGDAGIGTWLCRIVMNEAMGRLRRRRPTVDWSTMDEIDAARGQPLALPHGTPQPDPEQAAARHQIQHLLEEAIDRLPQDFRLVLMARIVEAMSIEETATLLDIRPETVKTRLHRARRMLREAVESRVGPVLKDVFPFEDPRCERIAEKVVAGLRSTGNL
ncbi:MAG: RNA polymerase sigma factor [Rhizobiales bacterium]|nr:RNA polymerase sigma factor [Hyphomicrobiales bacterium]MBN9010882.1 RNA polymerase sigma factor [Hyphomicrobiales bacterium]